MSQPDTIRITFSQNPAVMEALRDKKPGDKCTLVAEVTIKGQDPEGVDLIAEAWIPDGYERVPDTEEPAAETMGTGDVGMTPAAMMIRRKSKG